MEVHPDSFVCPILGTLMADPVVAADGHTYEKSAILEWFKTSKISPMTGLVIESASLIPNHALRKTIDDYCRGKPDRIASRESSRNPDFNTAKLAPTGAATTARGKIQPAMSSEERPPWEFDKKLLATASVAEKKPIILTTSRTSLYSGEAVIVGFEPTADGSEFNLALTHNLKLEKTSAADASLSSIERISDDTFVAGNRNGSVSVWKLERSARDGKLSLKKLWQAEDELHSDETTCVAFIPAFELLDTNASLPLLASGSRDRTVKLWKPSGQRWSHLATLDHRSEVKCVAGLKEGHVVSGGADWALKVWDPNTPDDCVQALESHSRAVRCVSVEHLGARLASGSDDESIIVWDPRLSDPVVQKIDTGSPVLTICWGDTYLCAGGGTATDSMSGGSGELLGGWVRFWDPRTWNVLGDAVIPQQKGRPVNRATKSGLDAEKLLRNRSAHEIATHCLENLKLAGNQSVISGGDDKKLRIWVSPPLSETPFYPRPSLAYELGGEKVIPIAVDALATFFV